MRGTQAFWNSQLENAVTVPDFAAWQDRHGALSAEADRLGQPERIATGAGENQAVWRTPLGRADVGLVFVHGGYWRRYSADNFSFVAETAAAAKATLYNVDYRLMPAARMADLVDDTLAACNVAARACERVLLVGHSAGAHLAVEAALRADTPPSAVVAVSGLYELAPLRHAFIQDELQLTLEEVEAFSPQDRVGDLDCPLHLRVGADETVEFRRASARLFDAAIDARREATIDFVTGRHHMSVVADLADPRTALSRLVQHLLA
ncbi:alpha/beta hydrolase [Acuticoccus sp.]|uniref:alpha/beta hydrolase n=1 Tax=Acuticoccus sp. TaxID=1904378 RepID=UPI003B51F28F